MYKNIGVNLHKEQSNLIKQIKIPKISKNSVSYKANTFPETKLNYNNRVTETSSELGSKNNDSHHSMTFYIMDKKVNLNKKTLAVAGVGALAGLIGISLLKYKLKK